jgi:hypothetical protein
MKWNWIKNGGPLPKPLEDVLCYDVDYKSADFFYVACFSGETRDYDVGLDWIISYTGENIWPPEAWAYLEPPVKPSEDK